MQGIEGRLNTFREMGKRQRDSWLVQHIQDFVAGLVRHGYDAELDSIDLGTAATIIIIKDATRSDETSLVEADLPDGRVQQ